MVDESVTFGISGALLVVGLAVMLGGVTLNSGQAFNVPIIAGGAIVLVAVAVLTGGVMALEGPEGAESGEH